MLEERKELLLFETLQTSVRNPCFLLYSCDERVRKTLFSMLRNKAETKEPSGREWSLIHILAFALVYEDSRGRRLGKTAQA